MAALAAAITVGTVQAKGVYKPGQVIGAGTGVTGNVTVDQINAGAVTDKYAPTVKDGADTITINPDGSETLTAPLNVREGKVVVTGEAGEELVITGKQGGVVSGTAAPWLSVGGTAIDTDADGEVEAPQMVINGVTVRGTSSSVNVGNPDGAGSLLVTNGGKLDITKNGSSSLFIGLSATPNNVGDAVGSQNSNATTKNPGSDDRYSGTYTDTSKTTNGAKEYKFGKGEVTVKGQGSSIEAGSCIGIAEGTLNVEDHATVVAGNREVSLLGDGNGVTSVINVKNQAELIIKNHLYTGYKYDTTNIINVENATMTVEKEIYLGVGYNYDDNDFTGNGSTTEMNLTGASTVSLDTIVVGYKDSSAVSISAQSKLVGQELNINEAGSVESSGTIDMTTLAAEGGSLVLNGNAKVNVADATFTRGQLTVTDVATFTGNVTLDGDSILTLGLGSTIFMTGGTLDMNASTIYVDLGDKNLADVLASKDAIFTINYIPTESDVEMGTVNVQFVNIDAEGNRVAQGETIALANTTARIIPEPTTATLSLLALAGLAMRRRRK